MLSVRNAKKKTIWKAILDVQDIATARVPVGSQLLCAKSQHENICLWFVVDSEQTEMVERIFRIVGTGHTIREETLMYIDTVQVQGGSLVFHVFEVITADNKSYVR